MLKFNRSLTRQLLLSSEGLNIKTKQQIDWGIDNANKLYGSIYKSFWLRTTFLILKDKEEYFLICLGNRIAKKYLIEDIDKYLGYVGIDEIFSKEAEGAEKINEFLEDCKKARPDGFIKIDEEKIYLYDFNS